MEKQVVLNRIQTELDALMQFVENIAEADFFKQLNPEKWSIGQNIQHLISVKQRLVGVFANPEIMAQWGKSSGTSKSYEEVKTFYTNALKTPPPFLQVYRHLDTEGSKAEMLGKFKVLTAKLLADVNQMAEMDLDTTQIPHPLIGLLTAREMLHFTGYHIRHHHNIIEKISL